MDILENLQSYFNKPGKMAFQKLNDKERAALKDLDLNAESGPQATSTPKDQILPSKVNIKQEGIKAVPKSSVIPRPKLAKPKPLIQTLHKKIDFAASPEINDGKSTKEPLKILNGTQIGSNKAPVRSQKSNIISDCSTFHNKVNALVRNINAGKPQSQGQRPLMNQNCQIMKNGENYTIYQQDDTGKMKQIKKLRKIEPVKKISYSNQGSGLTTMSNPIQETSNPCPSSVKSSNHQELNLSVPQLKKLKEITVKKIEKVRDRDSGIEMSAIENSPPNLLQVKKLHGATNSKEVTLIPGRKRKRDDDKENSPKKIQVLNEIVFSPMKKIAANHGKNPNKLTQVKINHPQICTEMSCGPPQTQLRYETLWTKRSPDTNVLIEATRHLSPEKSFQVKCQSGKCYLTKVLTQNSLNIDGCGHI